MRIRFISMSIIFIMRLCSVFCEPEYVFSQTVPEGISLYNAKNFTQAEKVFQTVLKADKNNLDAQLFLTRIYLEQNKFNQAEQMIKRAESAHKNNPAVYMERAKLELRRPGKSKEYQAKSAELYLKKALELDPSSAEVYYSLYEAYFTIGDSAKAFTALGTYIKKSPQSIRAYLAMAGFISYYEYNIPRRCEKIESVINTALEQGTATTEELCAIGWWLFTCGDVVSALDCYRQAMRNTNAIGYNALMDAGMLAEETYHYGEAFECFQKGFAGMPESERLELINPKHIPAFLSSSLTQSLHIDLVQFLNPAVKPASEEVFNRKLHHYAFMWCRHRTEIKRAEPLELSGTKTFTEPYLIHWGMYNYIEYAFYFLLNENEQHIFQQFLRNDELEAYQMNYFIRNDPTPSNGKDELYTEFLRRVKYVYQEFPILPNPSDKTRHSRDFTGYDDRGKVYLKYGEPNSLYIDFGGNDVLGNEPARTISQPMLLDEIRVSGRSGRIIVIKPNISWYYDRFDRNLFFDFVEMQKGYFTLVDNLDEAGYGNRFSWMLFLNRAYEGSMTGIYEQFLYNYDRRNFTPNDYGIFVAEFLIPEEVKKDEIIEKYPTNIIDVVSPAKTLAMNLDFATFKGDSGKTILELYTGINHRNLEFKKSTSSTEKTDVQYWVALLDKSNSIVQQDSGTSTITQDVSSKQSSLSDIRQFELLTNPDNYSFNAKALNPQGNKLANLRGPVELRNYNVDTLIISDIQLASDIVPAEQRNYFVKNGLSVIPYPFRIVKKTQPISIYFEIYNLSLTPTTETHYDIEYTLRVINPNYGLTDVLKSIIPGRQLSPSISVKNSRNGNKPYTAEYSILELGALIPGDAELTVTVTDKIANKITKRVITFKIF